MDRVIATRSADDTAVALRLLKVLEESGQMTLIEVGEWRRRIDGWERFGAIDDGDTSRA